MINYINKLTFKNNSPNYFSIMQEKPIVHGHPCFLPIRERAFGGQGGYMNGCQ